MRQIHYRNIGYPKTGTTWLYHQLNSHPDVDGKISANYKEYNPYTKEKYMDFYKEFSVSFNLYTLLFTEPNKLYTATHITCTLRNLYELLNTWYNYLHYNPNFKMSVNDFLKTDSYNFKLITNVEKIFNDWKNYDVKFLFYDDLQKDNQLYFHEICDYLNIKRYYDSRITPKFKTRITQQILFEDTNLIKYINEKICIIEDHTKRDLSHWKK